VFWFQALSVFSVLISGTDRVYPVTISGTERGFYSGFRH